MQTNETTIERLRYLEAVYRQGYRSDLIDQGVDKIIAMEIASAQADLTDLQARLGAFERHYQMKSEMFYRHFRSGELGDDPDFVEWSSFYEMWDSVRKRIEILRGQL
ncbi:hypothetical protein QUF72_19965 [Desulfobacterales bacterium HSG2]|nr:hypothetical protein [Desulfobacterales bacterium HSG2]